jgi:hypothetical protein
MSSRSSDDNRLNMSQGLSHTSDMDLMCVNGSPKVIGLTAPA